MRTKSIFLGIFCLTIGAATMPLKPAQAVTCASFTTQEEAQAYMEQYGARKLDGDKDGIACERLPRSGRSAVPVTAPVSSSFQVVSVGDGDTLTVKNSRGDRVIVRLACVDAPEMAQKPYGEAAATRLKQLAPVGESVSLRVVDQDRYGRSVAEVSRGSTNVNLQMVIEGQAVVYRQYLSGCSQNLQQQLLQAEKTAKQKKVGFWQQSNPVLPEVYRRANR
jgi:endonuclease YncB( thermonuclease family)